MCRRRARATGSAIVEVLAGRHDDQVADHEHQDEHDLAAGHRPAAAAAAAAAAARVAVAIAARVAAASAATGVAAATAATAATATTPAATAHRSAGVGERGTERQHEDKPDPPGAHRSMVPCSRLAELALRGAFLSSRRRTRRTPRLPDSWLASSREAPPNRSASPSPSPSPWCGTSSSARRCWPSARPRTFQQCAT